MMRSMVARHVATKGLRSEHEMNAGFRFSTILAQGLPAILAHVFTRGFVVRKVMKDVQTAYGKCFVVRHMRVSVSEAWIPSSQLGYGAVLSPPADCIGYHVGQVNLVLSLAWRRPGSSREQLS